VQFFWLNLHAESPGERTAEELTKLPRYYSDDIIWIACWETSWGSALAYKRSFRITGIAIVAGCISAVASSTNGVAATVEEVAHCRALPQLAERLSCFKSLKRSTAKTQDAAPEIQQPAKLRKVKDADSRANAKAPDTPEKTEQAAPTPTDEVPPSKDEASASKKDTTTQSNAGERLLPPTRDDPVTTSSIDRLSFAHDRPLCTDRDALAAMILAGLLTSDPSQADTPGCQTIPEDAKLELLERSPSVFPFMRMVRVKVISPTHPDLTSGFTIEIGR
jgi:hypothetical protein